MRINNQTYENNATTFHDYLGNGDDEGVISIPFVEYCGTGDEISLEQFRQIVEKAEWQEQTWVKMEEKIEYDDPVALLARGRIEFPATLGEIHKALETHYNTYLAVIKEYDDRGFYFVLPDDGETHMSSRKSELIYGTFKEAMYALIMKFNEINKRQ